MSEIDNKISRLKKANENRLAKYNWNYRRYTYSKNASITNIKGSEVVGIAWAEMGAKKENDTGYAPQVNVIKSCIDTLTSKIAQSKVRPYFNTINGGYHDLQVAKQSQIFFDCFYSEQDVNKTVSEAFKDGCIFDTGCIFVNRHAVKITKALPSQIFVLPEETTYNEYTLGMYEQTDYPCRLVLKQFKDKLGDYAKRFLENNDTCTLIYLYDLIEKKEYITIKEVNTVIEYPYEADVLPFVFLRYVNTVKGNSSQSVVDMLNGIQMQIDIIMAKVTDAANLTPANTILVPQGSDIKASQINNKIGKIIQYRPTPDGSPVTVMTNAFIDPQYMMWYETLKATAYEMVGISQLSAVSQKPTGLNSGVSLQTMENIESDRFETQLNNVIRAYVDIAKICVKVFDQNADILPKDRNRSSLKWKDIVKNIGLLRIQFSGADALSKDPSTKLQQLQLLSQAGILNSARIAQLMEIPDLEQGYNIATNAINGVQVYIENYLHDRAGDVIPDFIPIQILKEEVINTQLALYQVQNKENEEDIEKLQGLYNKILELEKQEQEKQKQQAIQEGIASEIEQSDIANATAEVESVIEGEEKINADGLVANEEVDTDLETGDKTW